VGYGVVAAPLSVVEKPPELKGWTDPGSVEVAPLPRAKRGFDVTAACSPSGEKNWAAQ